jgi:hypothetical protein
VGSQIDGFSHPWHLAADAADVDNDGIIAPIDALMVINYLNSVMPATVPADAQIGGPYGFIDVSGDGVITPLDAIIVINFLNSRSDTPEGEAPAAAAEPASSLCAIDEVFGAVDAWLPAGSLGKKRSVVR